MLQTTPPATPTGPTEPPTSPDDPAVLEGQALAGVIRALDRLLETAPAPPLRVVYAAMRRFCVGQLRRMIVLLPPDAGGMILAPPRPPDGP